MSLYAASVPVFTQMLSSLASVLDKAGAHITDKKLDPDALLQARLFPDMFPLIRQVQIAADFAKGATARLAGLEVPKYEDNEVTLADLQARIAKTLAFIGGVEASQIAGSEQREISIGSGDKLRHFKGQAYLLHYALPHFYFHVTTAYDILRHNGVAIGKADYIGTWPA
jgi:hypothetical protein